jgi:hypothetical protein
MRPLAPAVHLSIVCGELNREKRTSAAKAVKREDIYGTAEPVPFVQRRFFLHFLAVATEPAVCAECALKPDVFSIVYDRTEVVPFVQSLRKPV